MNYNEFKDLCREAWKEKYSYLKINRLDEDENILFVLKVKKNIKFLNQRLNHFRMIFFTKYII